MKKILQKNQKRRLFPALLGGAAAGALNGLLGAGGGMVLVPLLETLGVRGKKSHATSLAVVVPLSAASAWLYHSRGWLDTGLVLACLPGALAGAAAGAWLLHRVRAGWLKTALGVLMLWAGVRSLWAG